ncbi:MAG: ELWxxDGT repeat protein [Candidatus Rokuibacteriota bacterium]
MTPTPRRLLPAGPALLALLIAVTVPAGAAPPPPVARVVDLAPGPVSSAPGGFRTLNATVYYAADDGAHGRELWRTDGTAAGTALVEDVHPGPADSNGGMGPVVGGALFFAADDGVHGMELWRSDGSAAGTALVLDINPGNAGGVPTFLGTIGETLFFAADDGVHGRELWTSDGTAAGTLLLADIRPGPGGSVPDLAVVANGTLFFRADDGAHGSELWKTDGTTGGTSLVADIAPGAVGSGPMQLTAWNGMVFFWRWESGPLRLWRSDGTAAGTVRVADVDGLCSGLTHWGVHPRPLAAGTALFFHATDPAHGCELWRTDGTAAGTRLVKDINPGPADSHPGFARFTVVDGTLFFDADDGVHGSELWRSDGTEPGTTLVADIDPGPASSNPGHTVVASGVMLFVADDGLHGYELWKTDGTAGGTALVADIEPNEPGRFGPTGLADVTTASGASVFFTACDPVHGCELWRTVPSVALEASRATVHAGDAIELRVTLANPGPALPGDVYLGALLPASLGPGAGCPLGDAVAFFVEGPPGVIVRCLSEPPGSYPALARGVVVPVALPAQPAPAVFRLVWPSGAPPGDYVFFIVVILPGGLDDDRLDPGDVLSAATATVRH